MLYYERKFRKKGYRLIAGVDEAGRGPLAGPVVAAAVVLKTTRFKSRIDDSKKLTLRQREDAFREIISKSIFGIGVVNEKIIDEVNIQTATCMAMKKAIKVLIDKLKTNDKKNICILVDGNIKLDIDLDYTNIIRGDARSKSIASASILAKVIRDRIMSVYDKMYPGYGFSRHKGYGTKLHRIVLRKIGPSIIHRKTFCNV